LDKNGEKYHIPKGNFETHVVPLFLICVHLYDIGELKHLEHVKSYKDINDDIFKAFLFNYVISNKEGEPKKKLEELNYFYTEMCNNPKKYIHEYSPKNLLVHLRERGIKVFFATNGPFEFAQFILEYHLGPNYMDYFDFGCFYAKKPGFFTDPNKEAFFIDTSIYNNKTLPSFNYTHLSDPNFLEKLKQKKAIIGGSYKICEEYFKSVLNKEKVNLFSS
jgi:hypothetical protein